MMKDLGPHNAIYIGDGEWLAHEDFGDIDPDEPQHALLPVLEWQAEMQRRYPRADLAVIRQFIRLLRAASEFHESTGRHLNVYGVLGELYASMAWGIALHKKHNAEGSDGKLGDDFVEVKTIGGCGKADRVRVKLSGNFSKLIVVKIEQSPDTGAFALQSRMVARRALTSARSGYAGIAWSRACALGEKEPNA